MDESSNALPPQYHSQPMASWYPMEAYSEDAAYTLADRSHSGDLASFPPTQLHPLHTMDVYPFLPIGAERTSEHHPFPQDPSFPPTNGFPAGSGPPDTDRIDSNVQSEVEDVESDPDDVDSDSDSDSEPPDYPLPAAAARWISMSPAQFDREYPRGNPFVVEELSLDSEEDPESVLYAELGASALNRIFIIFWAAEQAIFPFTSARMYRDIIWDVLADLLKDGKIWLWVDGDEEKCADLHRDRFLDKSFEYVKRKLSCSSLQLQTPCIPTSSSCWERVSKGSFAMRVLTITWATFTSVSVREAGWVRGCADWTRSALGKAAWAWYHDVLWMLDVVKLLGDEGWNSHFEIAFKDTLQYHGHLCYSSPEQSEEPEPLKLLLYLLSSLSSTPSRRDLSIILFGDPDEGWSCQQCAKLKEVYIANSNARHIPSLSLLALNDLRLSLDIDMVAWRSILALGISCGIISTAILSKMDDKIRRLLDTDKFDLEYQPWVNRLPRDGLRGSVTACSESEWREAEHAVWMANQHASVTTSRWDSPDIGLGVRITAVYLLMSEDSSQKLTPRKYRSAFYVSCHWNDILNGALYPVHIAALVEAFCEATSESSDVSTHTCCEFGWAEHSLELRRCYAAAYLLLHPELQDVPLLEPLRRPVPHEWCSKPRACLDCEQCRKLPEAEPLVPTQISVSDATNSTISPADGMDNIVPTLKVMRRNSPVSITVSQVLPSTSSQSRASTLPKDVILPQLKTHFAKLLAQHNIPIQYTNLGAPQLPWCTLPQLLRNRHLEIAGWPEELPLPDATGKHNAKGIMGLTAKDARRLHKALPGIWFRPMDKARVRPREEESDVGDRPAKKAKGKGKAQEKREKKFRLSEVQMVIPGMRIGKSN